MIYETRDVKRIESLVDCKLKKIEKLENEVKLAIKNYYLLFQ